MCFSFPFHTDHYHLKDLILFHVSQCFFKIFSGVSDKTLTKKLLLTAMASILITEPGIRNVYYQSVVNWPGDLGGAWLS
jgi:hypothetical protein